MTEIDVLIVGAGPAGLMMALWMARLGVSARIVEKRPTEVFSGLADGFQLRTMEILDSFGIGERVEKEANHMIEVTFWGPGRDGTLQRMQRRPDVPPRMSRFVEMTLHQGRLETFFLDAIRSSYTGAVGKNVVPVSIERSTIPTAIHIDKDKVEAEDAYPVTVTLKHLSAAEIKAPRVKSNLSDIQPSVSTHESLDANHRVGEEKVICKYVVGCDGAHSWTRNTLGQGFAMVGEMTDHIWGVLDIIPITDFPDIRARAMVHGVSGGTMMVISRESGMVRLYIELTEVLAGGTMDRASITPDMILDSARRILAPYTLSYHFIDWWTAYQVGQRVGERFSKLDRVFLAGDAVHTHSPKAGQGRNVSMQDTYNLGWKIGLVCQGLLQRRVLSTYELERKVVAKQLIAFDRRFAALFSGRSSSKGGQDETEELSQLFKLSAEFTTALGISYQPSLLVAKPKEGNIFKELFEVEIDDASELSTALSRPELAVNCKPGTRFPSYQVVGQSDARSWQLHRVMPSDGRFRLVVFAGDISDPEQKQRVNELGAWLARRLLPRYGTLRLSPASDLHAGPAGVVKFRTDKDPSIIDVLAVHSTERNNVEILRDFHDVYHPFDSRLGWNYDKIFVDGPTYHAEHGQAYEGYGVDKKTGAVVVVRPDGYVGLVTTIGDEGRPELEKWFDGVLRPAR